LWNHVGGAIGVKKFLLAAHMSHTIPGSGGYWGLTQVTARDQIVLLRTLAQPGLLSASRRAYLLGLMRSVIADQRWGVPAGAPDDAIVANKNGWLPSATVGWRINSIGYVTGDDLRYAIAVLSVSNPSMETGISRIQAVAKAIHRTLG
jgi:hypothetical protein